MRIIKKILYTILTVSMCLLIYSNIVKAATTLKVTTDTLNLREKPSTDSDILTLLSNGDICELIKESGDWYQVKYKDYTGYVTKEYVKKQDSTSKSEEKIKVDDTSKEKSDNDKNPEETKNNDEITIVTGKVSKKVDIKILPLIYSTRLGSLNKNTSITIVSETNGWSYVETNNITGWIRTDCITDKKKIITGDTEPDSSSKPSDNQTTGNDNNKPSDNTGANDNKPTTSDNEYKEKIMYTNDSYVNLRKQASTSADILMTVEINTKLTVIGESGDWYQVKTSEGNAYVSKKLLSDKLVSVTTSRGGVDRRDNSNEKQNETDTSTSVKNQNKVETTKVAQKDNSSKTDTSSTQGKQIVEYAKKFLGVPYVYGGASSSGFDCSGFTMYVYKKFGISMGHGAQMQSRVGKEVKNDKTSASSIKNNLQPGDLVFFLDYETMDEIGHCGIYIGDGNFIHASSGSGYCVKINSLLPGEYYNTRYCAARRVI